MTIFQSARVKLTAWYLLIIMSISALFSVAIYSNVTSQIRGFVRMHNDRVRSYQFGPLRYSVDVQPDLPFITTEELQKQEHQIAYSLFLINLFILAISGAAGFVLAGRTLRPIKLMIDEQDQFISDASHELRTPIATIRAELEAKLLEKKITDKDSRKLIASSLDELTDLQALSNSLLRLTKIHDLGQNKKNMQPVSLIEVIKIACSKVSVLAKKKRVRISTKASESIINGNRESLIELFVILLDNAIKYSHANSEIIIRARRLDHRLKVSITDHGIGISEDDLLHIFERFYRADKSRSLVDGHGLGLSIAKKIAELHGGSIEAHSIIDSGSTFSITLPLIIS